MNSKTLKALKESIAHWKRMKEDPNCGEKPYDDDCPLCRRFDSLLCELNGEPCPVMARTGMPGCQGSPYSEAYYAWRSSRDTNQKDGTPQWRSAAQREIDFLESLLPKTKKTTKRKKA